MGTLGILKHQVIGSNFIFNFALKTDEEKFNTSLFHQFSNANGLILNRRTEIQLKRASGQAFPADVTINNASLSDQTMPKYVPLS
jgi:hypothetical protein